MMEIFFLKKGNDLLKGKFYENPFLQKGGHVTLFLAHGIWIFLKVNIYDQLSNDFHNFIKFGKIFVI